MSPLHPDWFEIREAAPGIFAIREPGHVNAFLVCGKDRAALIDTGMGFTGIRPAVAAVTELPVLVLNTHWHFDHVGGNREFETAGIFEAEQGLAARPLSNKLLKALYLDPCTALGLPFPRDFRPDLYEIANPLPDRGLSQGDRLDLGGRALTVLHTPGHTRGSASFLDSRTGFLFCGDLVYEGTLYAHFTDSDPQAYLTTLDRLAAMGPAITGIGAGHNSPVLSPDILTPARNLIRQALAGRTAPREDLGWPSPVLRHSGSGLELLTPVPGSPGIDLLKLLPEKA